MSEELNKQRYKVLSKPLFKQWVLCCYALSFFSRCPVPKSINFKAYPFHLGNAYFPFVGALYALICFAVYCVSLSVFDHTISIIFMLLVGLLLTGAFHEDGLADCCDGFGGGYNKKQCLSIMKDSQIGTYGVIGLIILFALKVTVLIQLSLLNQFYEFGLLHFFGVLFSAAVVSRFSALCLIQYSEYAREDETSKSTQSSHQLPLPYLLGASLFSLLSLLWMPVISILVIVIVTTISTLLCKSYFHKKIEGYTGDCLGFLQQLNELLILLTCLALFSANL
ncbi:adenosylcobinamide-GDP ribazoletransferase [Psychromonas sp. SP041]|uniref:adenosylcobinamide-GDP ribazoletransferase n=1 Tax=Psychromonas sp. SP041 TaxID=1365007 RepID=UPI00040E9B70|nr:adenosylcobinamide-GDP ribazoletransferase [Psychromonas sp. SP041]